MSTTLIVVGVVLLAAVYWVLKKGLKLLALALVVGGVFAVATGLIDVV